jgi:transcription termination factor Rho
MLLPELKQLAGTLGIKGTGALRKGQLIEAIKAAQTGAPASGSAGAAPARTAAPSRSAAKAKATQPTLDEAADAPAATAAASDAETPAKREGGSRRSRAAAQKEAQDVPQNGATAEAASAPFEAPAATAQTTVQTAGQTAVPSVETRSEERADDREDRSEGRGRDNSRTRDRDNTRTRDREQSRDANREQSREAGRDANREGSRDANREQSREGGREQSRDSSREQGREGSRDANREQGREGGREQSRENRGDRGDSRGERDGQNRGERSDRNDRGDSRIDSRNDRGDGRSDRGDRNRQQDQGEDGEGRRRRRRGRDRDRNTRDGQPAGGRDSGRDGGRDNARNRGRGERFDPEPTISEDDILVPAAGILDVLDNYAFVRTSGYLPGPNDVYVALSMVKRYGLRKGDAITGAVKQPQEGERKEKFNPLVRIDTVNGADPEIAKQRQDFNKLTPLYATERLRLETEPGVLTTRIVDIVSPIGKGQRGLIVSPPKAGKTMVLQALANAITTNNPEVHLMVVLVDERPEEVTDMQRTVKGEVIASTFDRPADDHTTVAELAIERAKRLVELGHDVVVLLDSITRLGRAYNIAAPASGRILSGGVDSSALYPPKRFFGAARNIEDGGSLTILATALIETGSKMDEVIFEEFKGTGNMELRLRREFADRRIFPAIDVVASGTRREELLMSKDETQVVWKLRRVLSALDGQAALELLIGKLKESKSNIEFLLQVNKTTPSTGTTHNTTNGD